MHKAIQWALYHVWFQNISELYLSLYSINMTHSLFQTRENGDMIQSVIRVNVSDERQLGEEEEQGPVLLAQIEGPEGKQTQPFIIQAPPGSKLDGNNLTPEIYEVLKNLSLRVGNPEETNIMVSQIDPRVQDTVNNLVFGGESADLDGDKQYFESPQEDMSIEQFQSNVKSIPGTNRVIVSDGDKQIEVDISPTFQNDAVKLESRDEQSDAVGFFPSEGPEGLAFSMADNQTGVISQNQIQGQLVTPHGSRIENQNSLSDPKQEVLVQMDDNIGLSLDQMQQLIQQQFLQHLQSQGADQQVQMDVSQLHLEAAQQLGAGDQVQLDENSVQLTENQLGQNLVHLNREQLNQLSNQVQAQQVQGTQVPYQVQISADQVPREVQMFADQVDQVLGQASQQ